MYDSLDNIKSFVQSQLPSYTENEVEIVPDESGYTIYVAYDDTDVKIRELEECFMEVMMLGSLLEAWNMIHEYSEEF